jgi:hypothetical protein
MTQYELFPDDRYTPARASDPPTSHAGAAHIEPKLNDLQREFMRRLGVGGKTANEVARGQESIRKRAKELVRQGVLVELEPRRCGVTGKVATVYIAR